MVKAWIVLSGWQNGSYVPFIEEADYGQDEPLPYLVSADARVAAMSLTTYFTQNEHPLRERLYRHGAILFRGFDIADQSDFGHVAEHMASPLIDYRGGVAARQQLGKNIYNSTSLASDRTLAAHNEKSYSASHPDLVLFCCAIKASTGGATPLADGRRVWQRLSENLKAELRTRPITYIQNLHAGDKDGKSWMTVYQTNDREKVSELLTSIKAHFYWNEDGSLHIEETVSPVKQHPVTGEEALFCPADRWYRDVSEFGIGRQAVERASSALYHYCRFQDGEGIAPEVIAELDAAIQAELLDFEWHRGDVLLIDNRIVLHGRSPFTGERLVLVAMGTDQAKGMGTY